MTKNNITLTFPDGSNKDFESGITGSFIAESISLGLLRKAVGIKLDDNVFDLSSPIKKSGTIKVLTFEDEDGKNIFRHSSAHLMAQAILRLYPEAKLTIGPVVSEGFYYDIDHTPFNQEDLLKIETEMAKIVKENIEIKRKELSIKEALKLFANNKYKVEIIKNVEEFGEGKTEKSDIVSIYSQGEFFDLCRGPHLPNTGMIKAFKLIKVAGAYWRGDSKNKQLQRIYGISFPDKKDLNAHLILLEEAEKRDHRKLGKSLDLFQFHEYSPGSPFFFPKGATIYNELLSFIRTEYRKRGYEEVITPLLYDKALWETSGHWEHFKENMFLLDVDGREFSLKPMNCPSHLLMYRSKTKSYRDLPWRVADFAPLHRNELRGVLGGLTRDRKFSQDDAHIFCTDEQMKDEIFALLDFVDYVYSKVFGMTYQISIGTKPDKYLGSDELWEKAEQSLIYSLESKRIPFKISTKDGAFYGPKIDIRISDVLNREWQCATIQLDFQMPLRFEATYEGKDGSKHTPIMIHRAILGSLERFIGIITEHFAGKFPLWLSPVQVKILTVADRHELYADSVFEKLTNAGIRVEKDYRSESISKKVRDAQLAQANYIVIIGDKEEESDNISIRTRAGKILDSESVDGFLKDLLKEISSKRL